MGTLCNVKSLIMWAQLRALKSMDCAVSAAKLQIAETSQSSCRAVPIVVGQPPHTVMLQGLPCHQLSSLQLKIKVFIMFGLSPLTISLLFSFTFDCSEWHRQT